jgi:dipeptidyl-peptidase-4
MFRCFACAFLLAVCAPAAAEPPSLERLFTGPDLSGDSLRSPAFSPDSRLVAYLRGKDSDPGQLDLWAYDIAARRHQLLVDSALLAPVAAPLSAEEAARRERQRTAAYGGIVEFEFSPDSRQLLIPLGGDLYVYDRRQRAAQGVRRITNTAAAETDARFSPRGRYLSYVRDGQLYVFDLQLGEERPVTPAAGGTVSYAMAEFIAQEEMERDTGYWWSPDDTQIAYTRVDEAAVGEQRRFEIQAERVDVVSQRYPATGTPNARVDLYVVRLAGGEPVSIDLGPATDIYLARVDWFPDGRQLAVQRQSRDQQTLTLLAADAATGATRTLLEERSDTWVELHSELRFLERSPRFIWASARSGYQHLYLYENDGRLVRPLTAGDWLVTGSGRSPALKGVDEQRGMVYFTANRDSVVERHLYSVSLRAPGEPRRVTSGAGWHAVAMSDDAERFLDTYSTTEQPASVTLRDPAGRSLQLLVANRLDARHPYAPYLAQHAPTEFGTLAAADGQILHYKILKPGVLEPGRRYPVIVDVYGGPSAQNVANAWENGGRSNEGFIHQYLAQQGYIVFTLDNRGSGRRGTAFEGALYRRFGSVEVEDQVRGVAFLRSLPYVDPERIGVFGWSYGGYLALMCVLQAPGSFAAAIAGAPVTDWRLYDTHYTERYMGTPQDNAAGYTAGDVLTWADRLERPLLVIHGMADDNVLFTHSTALFKKLQDAGKPFDVMTYPGGKHGLTREPVAGLHAWRMIERYFDQTLRNPPRR